MRLEIRHDSHPQSRPTLAILCNAGHGLARRRSRDLRAATGCFPGRSTGRLVAAIGALANVVARHGHRSFAEQYLVARHLRGCWRFAAGCAFGLAARLVPITGRSSVGLVLLVPFMVPPYIAAMGWILLLQPAGFLQQTTGMHAAGLLFSIPGVVLVMVLNLFPVVYFAVSRAAAAAGGRMALVARVCGANPWQALWRITLPLALPAMAASALLVFAMTIEEYGTPAVLASNVGFLCW